jgi:hypothetical protein
LAQIKIFDQKQLKIQEYACLEHNKTLFYWKEEGKTGHIFVQNGTAFAPLGLRNIDLDGHINQIKFTRTQKTGKLNILFTKYSKRGHGFM